jgi:hypothetical protein
VASLHTTLLDARDDVHFLFKSSPFGSQSHGHNPQNTFQLNAYGEALLTSCVYRDLHGSKFHYGWAHSTVAQNAVLVNRQGQVKHAASSRGRIVAEELTSRYDYVAGDATAAYEGRLARSLRHVVFVKGDTPFIVLLDDLAAPEPATFQFMLHALKTFAIDRESAELRLERPAAGLTVRYLSPSSLAFRQWNGYDPKPTREFPNQWHVEAATTEKRKELALLTVIVPHRTGRRPEWKAERLAAPSGPALRVSVPGRTVSISFAKPGEVTPPRLEFN